MLIFSRNDNPSRATEAIGISTTLSLLSSLAPENVTGNHQHLDLFTRDVLEMQKLTLLPRPFQSEYAFLIKFPGDFDPEYSLGSRVRAHHFLFKIHFVLELASQSGELLREINCTVLFIKLRGSLISVGL